MLVLTLSVACSNQSPNNADFGYGSAPSTTSSPTIASSPTNSPTTTLAQSHWERDRLR
ncbi:MAG: hypothetical protein V7K21_13245 [Nostoc sp.]|uniref:hypothetical protein n=1 Tax=Nostoc sp. TaxID=1180 RepID=UPI002FF6DFC7